MQVRVVADLTRQRLMNNWLLQTREDYAFFIWDCCQRSQWHWRWQVRLYAFTSAPSHLKFKVRLHRPWLPCCRRETQHCHDKVAFKSSEPYLFAECFRHASRLIHSARVIDGQICYDIKDANTVYELFYTRFSLHKNIYNHKTSVYD